jgi:hypothetical protein
MVKSASGKVGLRSFTVVDAGKHGGCKTKFRGGVYKSRNARDAAKKAFRELCRVKRIRGVCTLILTLRETTQGSPKKAFSYKLRRHKLKVPKVIKLGNTEVVYEYESTATAIEVPVACRTPGQTRGRKKKLTSKKRSIKPNNVKKILNRLSKKLINK